MRSLKVLLLVLLIVILLEGCASHPLHTDTVMVTDLEPCTGNEHGYVAILSPVDDAKTLQLVISLDYPPTSKSVLCWLPGNRQIVVDTKAEAL